MQGEGTAEFASNTTIQIYPLSELEHMGCYQLVPQLRFQEPMYLSNSDGTFTKDFKVHDKDWLLSETDGISNYHEGVTNFKTILVDSTPSFLQEQAPIFIERPDAKELKIIIGKQTSVSLCKWFDGNIDEVLVDLKIESYQEIIGGKEQV